MSGRAPRAIVTVLAVLCAFSWACAVHSAAVAFAADEPPAVADGGEARGGQEDGEGETTPAEDDAAPAEPEPPAEPASPPETGEGGPPVEPGPSGGPAGPAALALEGPVGTACPEAPETPFEGADEAAAELRLMRRELVEICEYETNVLERTVEVLEGINADADEIRDGTHQLHTDLTEWPEGLPVKIAGQSGAPVEVVAPGSGGVASEVELVNAAAIADPVVESVDASGEAAQLALWFLAGVLVAGGVFYAIWRTVQRGV